MTHSGNQVVNGLAA